MKAVILAAGSGTRLEPITRHIPKCMVLVAGVPLIDRIVARMASAGIDELIVVTGYLHDVLAAHMAASQHALARSARLVFNDRYEEWGNFYSLLMAREAVGHGDFIKCDGDVVLDAEIIPALVRATSPAVLAIDRREGLGAEEMKVRIDAARHIVEINKRMDPALAAGEYVGVERIGAALVPALFDELAAMIDAGETHEYYERAYERLMQKGVPFSFVEIASDLWCEIDDAADLEYAHEIISRQERHARPAS